MIRAWIATFTAALDLRAAEMRTGISLVEAVAKEFTNELRAIVGIESVDEYREIALDAAKYGFTPEDAHDAFNQWLRTPHRMRYELEGIRRFVDGRIKANE